MDSKYEVHIVLVYEGLVDREKRERVQRADFLEADRRREFVLVAPREAWVDFDVDRPLDPLLIVHPDNCSLFEQ